MKSFTAPVKMFVGKVTVFTLVLIFSYVVGTSVSFTSVQKVHAAGNFDVNTASTSQEIDGFGAAGIGGMAEILSKYPTKTSGALLDLLFDPKTGAGFSVIRNEILSDNHDAGDPLWNWANPTRSSIEPSLGVWNWTGDTGQVWMMQEVYKRGVRNFLSVAWSPANWMKDNNSHIRGHLKPEMYQTYAEYLSRYVREYQTRFGIPITHVAPVHEPNYNAGYQSADWTPQEVRDLIKNNIGPTFARDGVNAKITIAEVNNWSGTMGHVQPTLDDPIARGYLGTVSGHGYEATPQYDYFPTVFAAGKKIWLTEDGDQLTSAGNRDSDWTARNWVKRIHGYLTKAHVSAWLYWYSFNGAWDGYSLTFSSAGRGGFGGDPVKGYLAGKGMDYRPEKIVYTISHITRFVRPGYFLLNAPVNAVGNSNIYTLAFKNPANGNIVIVAMNDSNTDYTLSGTISDSSITSLKPYVTDSKGVRNVAPQPRINTPGGTYSYNIPAYGVVTLVRDENQPDAPPANTAKTYISDLKASSAGSGWLGVTPVEIDTNVGQDVTIIVDQQSNKANYGGDGTTIRVANTNYTKGIGTQGSSYVSYYLGGRATSFSSIIGFDAIDTSNDSVTYQVWADGAKLYDSGSFGKTSTKNGSRINVDVTGKQEMALVVNSSGNDTKTNWADAYVVTGTGQGQNPTATLSISPTTPVTSGGQVTLTWSSTNAVSCIGYGDWAGTKTASATQSTETINNIVRNMSFGLRCTNASGVNVDASPVSVSLLVTPPPTVSFSSPATNVTSGGQVTLNWSVSNATSCTASAVPPDTTWSGSKNVGTNTQVWNNVTTSRTYNLSCVNTGNDIVVQKSVPIVVGQNNPPTVSLTSPLIGKVQTLIEGDTLPLVATASDTDGSVVKVEFFNTSHDNTVTTKISEDTNGADGWTHTLNEIRGGWYNLRAVATDNSGARATSSVFTASASSYSDSDPVVTIVGPTSVPTGGSVTAKVINRYDWNTDKNIVIYGVDFYLDGVKVGSRMTTYPATMSIPLTTPGNHIVSAKLVEAYYGTPGEDGSNNVQVTAVQGASQPTFFKGINFGPKTGTVVAGRVTVDGNSWMSQAEAEASGMTYTNSPRLTYTSKTPLSQIQNTVATDASHMLNTNLVWGINGGKIELNSAIAPNGTYDVYLYSMENYLPNFRKYAVNVEGKTDTVFPNQNFAVGQWAKYGPYRVNVTDGSLTLTIGPASSGDPQIMGVAIYSVPAGTASVFDSSLNTKIALVVTLIGLFGLIITLIIKRAITR